jgi:N-acyl-L-homoserine lactone synthetase
VEFLTGKTADLHPAVVTGLAEYRHRVFVEQLGWQLNCKEGLELDEFDHEGTLYVVARNGGGEVAGTARLLPTTQP